MEATEASETVQAFEAIASGLPVKVLIQTDDILGDPSPEPPRTSFGGGSTRLAAMAKSSISKMHAPRRQATT